MGDAGISTEVTSAVTSGSKPAMGKLVESSKLTQPRKDISTYAKRLQDTKIGLDKPERDYNTWWLGDEIQRKLEFLSIQYRGHKEKTPKVTPEEFVNTVMPASKLCGSAAYRAAETGVTVDIAEGERYPSGFGVNLEAILGEDTLQQLKAEGKNLDAIESYMTRSPNYDRRVLFTTRNEPSFMGLHEERVRLDAWSMDLKNLDGSKVIVFQEGGTETQKPLFSASLAAKVACAIELSSTAIIRYLNRG